MRAVKIITGKAGEGVLMEMDVIGKGEGLIVPRRSPHIVGMGGGGWGDNISGCVRYDFYNSVLVLCLGNMAYAYRD